MSETILVGTRKGVFTLKRGTSGWKIADVHFRGVPASIVTWDPRDRTMYAALGHGHFGVKMHRSSDDGKTWTEFKAPAYPELPSEEQAKGVPVLHLVWELVPGGADEPGTLWCGTVPGGLFKSTNRGDTWTFVRSLWDDPLRKQWFGGGMERPGIHSISVHPKNSKHVALAVSCGGAWVTKDGGETWTIQAKGMRAGFMPPDQAENPAIQDIHRMAMCPANPEVLWAQNHDSMYHSGDGAKTWQELKDVKPSNFGFAVVAHPTDEKTAWFVPAEVDAKRVPVDGKVVVTRTRDGGQTFETLREGLPQEHAYDIVFRHCLDVDETGARLAFGSTTGSFWISENGGDAWQTVSNHLPPVYCVRFVK
ncbi:MAG: exo-alpha-sialidase [Planctomycetota bacterium]|nr:exo-alpha-sialidase [Planctomycetota bacterium]